MENRTAIISGATSGIGKATVFELLKSGFFVAGFAPHAKKCRSLTKELSLSFDRNRFFIVKGDVRKEASLRKVVKAILKKFKRIDILINNAGVWIEGKLEENNLKDIQNVIQINTLGTILLTRLILPLLKKQQSGAIVNLSSQAGIYARKERSVYNASKWAVTGFTKALQEELTGSGIKVIGIFPGKIDTDLFKSAGVKKQMDDALTPEAVAKVISFALQSDESVAFSEIGIKHV